MTTIKIWVKQTKTTQCLEIIAAFERHINVQLKCFFTFKKKLFLILSCCVARLTAKKVNEIQGRGNITACQMFESLRGRHFPSEIPATEKEQKSQKRCVVCYSKDVQYQCGNCEQKPGLCSAPCFRLYHTAICYSQK